MSQWQAVVRVVHLQGGCRALNGMNPQVAFEPDLLNGGRLGLTLPAFNSLFRQISDLGVAVIGCDFLTSAAEAEGYAPPQWRSFNGASDNARTCAYQGDHWSFIANGAFKNGLGLLWDIAGRVSHQLRACDWRLRQLSDAYRDQLRSALRGGEFADNQRFMDGYTSMGYLALQAFLVEACVLR